MNLVKTYVDKSKIEGLGLFAGEFIAKGKVIWTLSEIDQVWTDEQFIKLLKRIRPLEAEFLDKYAFKKAGKIFLCGDDARYGNHSNDPNTYADYDYQVALYDIQKGEEITGDYSEIHENKESYIKNKNTHSQERRA